MATQSLILNKAIPIPTGITPLASIEVEKISTYTVTIVATAALFGPAAIFIAAPLLTPISSLLDIAYARKVKPYILANRVGSEKNMQLIRQSKNLLINKKIRKIEYTKTALISSVSLLATYVIHSISNAYCLKSELSSHCFVSNSLFYISSAASLITTALFIKNYCKRG